MPDAALCLNVLKLENLKNVENGQTYFKNLALRVP